MAPRHITIRHACPDDMDAMICLLQALFRLEADFAPLPDRQRNGLQRFLDGCGKHRCIQVAEKDGRVVGMATLQILISTAEGGPVGMVEDVVVHEQFRGKGVGRRLMASLVSWSVKRGLTRLQLLADRNNRSALDFYRRIGWRSTQLICLRTTELADR
jgi:GNAT superfamily N-acetyltransferase